MDEVVHTRDMDHVGVVVVMTGFDGSSNMGVEMDTSSNSTSHGVVVVVAVESSSSSSQMAVSLMGL